MCSILISRSKKFRKVGTCMAMFPNTRNARSKKNCSRQKFRAHPPLGGRLERVSSLQSKLLHHRARKLSLSCARIYNSKVFDLDKIPLQNSFASLPTILLEIIISHSCILTSIPRQKNSFEFKVTCTYRIFYTSKASALVIPQSTYNNFCRYSFFSLSNHRYHRVNTALESGKKRGKNIQ